MTEIAQTTTTAAAEAVRVPHLAADDLWRDFSKTALEFEERFATQEDCRAYWIKARWAGAGVAVVQTKAERREADVVQLCHWTISLLKRWLLGTHAGAVRPKHLQAYLDDFVFRYNRRKTKGVGRPAARVIEQLVARPPLTMKALVRNTVRSRWFARPPVAAA